MKTLKDFWVEHCEGCEGDDCECKTIRKELKQEARKQLDYKFKSALNAPDQATKDFLLGQCAFIDEFFNLDNKIKTKEHKKKCFWCNKLYVDLISHTKKIHPKLSPRSYEWFK